MKKLNWRTVVTGAVFVTLCDVAWTYYSRARFMEDRALFHENRADVRDTQFAELARKYRMQGERLEATERERDTAVAELERLRDEVNGTDVLRARILTIVAEAGDAGVTRGPIMAKLSRPQREHAGAMVRELVAEGALVEQPTEHSVRYVAVEKKAKKK